MKIVYFILNSFDFDSRARLEVEALKTAGHQVEIIATTGCESNHYLDCPIHRIPQWTWPSRKMRFIQYNILAALKAIKIKPDAYHAVDLDTLRAATWACSRTGGKVIYESRELYTEIEALNGRPFIRGIWRRLETRLIIKAARVITVNDSIGRELVSRYSIIFPNIIRNVAPKPGSLRPINLHSKYNIPAGWKILVFQGILRNGQGLLKLLEMIKSMERVSLVIIGDGPLMNVLKDRARSLSIENKIRFTGMIPAAELLNYTAGADAGMLLLEDVSINHRLALPQKLFQYLMAGIPQIVSPLPELAGFVSSEKTGFVASSASPEITAHQIDNFLFSLDQYNQAKRNCIESAKKHNWENESTKLIKMYEEMADSQ